MSIVRETKQKATPCYLKRDDPASYGKICADCSKRFGPTNPLGWIDIVLCDVCIPKRRVRDLSDSNKGYVRGVSSYAASK